MLVAGEGAPFSRARHNGETVAILAPTLAVAFLFPNSAEKIFAITGAFCISISERVWHFGARVLQPSSLYCCAWVREVACATSAVASAGIQQCWSVHAKVHALCSHVTEAKHLPAVSSRPCLLCQVCRPVRLFVRGNAGFEIFYCVRDGHPATAFRPRSCGAERPYSHPQPTVLGMRFHISQTLSTCVRLC